MTRIRPFPRRYALAGFALALSAVTALTWTVAFRQALGQTAERGRSDLALAGERLVTELQRYREFTVLMADHPALSDGDPARAEAVLQEAIDKTDTLGALVLDADGRPIAATGADLTAASRDAAFVARALDGALGSARSVLPRAGSTRAVLYAAPRWRDGVVSGVLVTAVDVAGLERDWRGSLPAIFFTDDTGQVFSTNRSELLFWQSGADFNAVSPGGRRYPVRPREIGALTILEQDWSRYIPTTALFLSEPLPVIGMTGTALVDVAPARRAAHMMAALVAAVALSLGALLFLALERRRALSLANEELERRVSARTEELARAQADLVRAEKLTALGKMSAGISHELNQPLMAISSHAENGAAFLERGRTDRAGENFSRIADLAQRMARIIQNLRAFARQDSAPVGRVGLAAAVESALEIVETRIAGEGAAVDWRRPVTPSVVIAGEVRLTQVIVNLLTNALDAMTGASDKRISLRVRDEGDRIMLVVEDTGPGIREPERIFDPFYSTREVGASEGMGLGLSISYGLVKAFGGDLAGENTGRGARFTLTLARAEAMAA